MSHTCSLNAGIIAPYPSTLPATICPPRITRLQKPPSSACTAGTSAVQMVQQSTPTTAWAMGWPQATAEAARIRPKSYAPPWTSHAKSECPSAMSKPIGWRISIPTSHLDAKKHHNQSPKIAHNHAKPRTRPELPHKSPLANMKRAAIVSPMRDEPSSFIPTHSTLPQNARHHNLIYTGFATDMCILGAEGGARDMLAHGYQCILMRDGTVGVETPSTYPEKLATRYGTHIFEWQLGYSTTFRDFAQAFSA